MADKVTTPGATDKPHWPVRWIPGDDPNAKPDDGVALCLSGGGYRAMLFHLGAVWRLNELGYLDPAKLKRVSSVSGGSLTAGVLALHWKALGLETAPSAAPDKFKSLMVDPIREQAHRTVDVSAALVGFADFGAHGSHLANFYGTLFGNARLADLSDLGPTFIFNATSLQSGELMLISKAYLGDWRVGKIRNPDLRLAEAVAASSSWPPVLSPTMLKVAPNEWDVAGRGELFKDPYNSDLVLTDGGVYDNLGLEAAFKRYRTILVSDADGLPADEPHPHSDWPLPTYRILMLFYNQIGSLRKRQLISAFESGDRDGTYWSMGSDIKNYPAAQPLACPIELTVELAKTPTRLEKVDDALQERIINWGYAIADSAVRSHVDQAAAQPLDFPYPRGVA